MPRITKAHMQAQLDDMLAAHAAAGTDLAAARSELQALQAYLEQTLADNAYSDDAGRAQLAHLSLRLSEILGSIDRVAASHTAATAAGSRLPEEASTT